MYVIYYRNLSGQVQKIESDCVLSAQCLWDSISKLEGFVLLNKRP